ncbi:hypothetical protein GH714_013465 [Hevea brasiliensis]|uniref:B box-type domain-containing protein n=1 Tax=Hevea brasiliensis TaxID=3981 RepID=A0A6A6KXF0_HEVBR|nr:hypothetical protein GH714_013465 [Hevea brasiliensis]
MKKCELCKLSARSYCESDEACLCWDCDARVHGANFLVARHTRNLLCQTCQSITPWKATGVKLGRTVSICDRCANGANRKEEEESEEANNDDVSTEDDDDLSTGDKEENEGILIIRVFCESVNVKSLKRTRESSTDLRSTFPVSAIDANHSSSQRRYGRPALTTQASGGGGDGEAISVDYSLSLRPMKDRRTETEYSFQAGSGSVAQ